jgi:hypothetical protein
VTPTFQSEIESTAAQWVEKCNPEKIILAVVAERRTETAVSFWGMKRKLKKNGIL